MLTGTCHCGAVAITVPRKPRRLTSCNCSICRRYGALWAYYRVADVKLRCARGTTQSYAWGERSLRFLRCRRCGCVMAWEPARRRSAGRMGVNARNFEPEAIAGIRVRRLDGADTWRFLD